MRREKAIIGLAASLALVGLVSRDAGAVNGWEESLNGSGTSVSTSQTTSSVSLALGSGTIQTNLDAANATTNPDEAGKVLSQTATITVGNTDGYNVYVSGNANLTGRNNSSHRIPSVSSSKTLGNMSNEWGYYATLGDTEASFNPSTNFKAMTTSQQSVGTGGATSSSVTKKLTLFYGARVNSSAVEDFYGNTVTLSVVARPKTVTTTFTTFDGATTMQEMTAAKCNKSNLHDTKQLTDTRDGKKYWVTKMMDGNCWMSQNLDLIISSGTALTPSTSDASWTPSRTTVPESSISTNTLKYGNGDDTSAYSWDLGNYVIKNPAMVSDCSTSTTGLSACAGESGQFIKVGAGTSYTTASTNPNFYQEHGATVYGSEYDAHYLAGNYYAWNAAVAETGRAMTTGAIASSSICPKGWKLPSSGDDNTNGTFGFLLSRYGVSSTATGTSNENLKKYDIALSPLFFVRGGFVSPPHYAFIWGGAEARYWSSRSFQDILINGTFYHSTYFLYLNSNNVVNTTAGYYRYYGFPIRCFVSTV